MDNNFNGIPNNNTYMPFSPQVPRKLWNPKFFIAISVIFSFLPAGILYSMNWRRLGDRNKANLSLLSSIIGFILFVVLLALLPFETKAIGYAVNIGIGTYLSRDQRQAFDNHVTTGGARASFVLPNVICIMCLIPVIALMIYSINIPNSKITVHRTDIYYTVSITKDGAEKLGTYLYDIQFINESNPASFKIDKQSGTYVFSLIIKNEYKDDPAFQDTLKQFAVQLSSDLYNGTRVEVRMCDSSFHKVKSFYSN